MGFINVSWHWKNDIHTVHLLAALFFLQGAKTGFSILPKDTSTCRWGRLGSNCRGRPLYPSATATSVVCSVSLEKKTTYTNHPPLNNSVQVYLCSKLIFAFYLHLAPHYELYYCLYHMYLSLFICIYIIYIAHIYLCNTGHSTPIFKI